MSQPSDTPETEAFYAKLYDASVPDVMIKHASGEEREKMRELERQRDAAREDAKRLYKALLIADDDGNYSAQAPGHAIAKALAAHEALTAKDQPATLQA